jgi:hypothetical protein
LLHHGPRAGRLDQRSSEPTMKEGQKMAKKAAAKKAKGGKKKAGKKR